MLQEIQYDPSICPIGQKILEEAQPNTPLEAGP